MTQKVGKILVSHKRLRELLDYNPETGQLFWRVHRFRWPAGMRAGYPVKRGYRRVTVANKEYAEHRVIWYWVTGKDSKLEIDHKDGVTSNNRWENLREATGVQNTANSHYTRKNKTGLRGVRAAGAALPGRMFYSLISHNRKHYHLGYFPTAEEAHQKYQEAAKQLRGEFYCDA